MFPLPNGRLNPQGGLMPTTTSPRRVGLECSLPQLSLALAKLESLSPPHENRNSSQTRILCSVSVLRHFSPVSMANTGKIMQSWRLVQSMTICSSLKEFLSNLEFQIDANQRKDLFKKKQKESRFINQGCHILEILEFHVDP